MTQSDFEPDAFKRGAARAAVVDAGASGTSAERITAVALGPSSAGGPPGAPPLLNLNYTITLDARREAEVYSATAARTTDDALAAAANERSNMRAARVEALAAPPQGPRPVAALPREA